MKINEKNDTGDNIELAMNLQELYHLSINTREFPYFSFKNIVFQKSGIIKLCFMVPDF